MSYRAEAGDVWRGDEKLPDLIFAEKVETTHRKNAIEAERGGRFTDADNCRAKAKELGEAIAQARLQRDIEKRSAA